MNESARYKIKYEVYPEDGMFIARCLDIDVASDGATDAEAVANLREAIELYFERNAEALLHDAESDEASMDDEA
jgi:predicted RNase H-like HicB family nuclease